MVLWAWMIKRLPWCAYRLCLRIVAQELFWLWCRHDHMLDKYSIIELWMGYPAQYHNSLILSLISILIHSSDGKWMCRNSYALVLPIFSQQCQFWEENYWWPRGGKWPLGGWLHGHVEGGVHSFASTCTCCQYNIRVIFKTVNYSVGDRW